MLPGRGTIKGSELKRGKPWPFVIPKPDSSARNLLCAVGETTDFSRGRPRVGIHQPEESFHLHD
jgi:hypothetical protein